MGCFMTTAGKWGRTALKFALPPVCRGHKIC